MHRAAVFLMLMTGSFTAHADDARAKQLFDEGRAAMTDGKLAKACAAFTQSLEEVAAIDTKIELGECLEKQGYSWRAWQMLVEAAADADSDAQKQRAKERATAIEAKLSVVIVKVTDPKTPGLGITVNGREFAPAAKIRELVDPGPVEVVAIASEGRFSRTVDAKQGEKITVTIPALAEVEVRRKRGWVYTAAGFGLLGGVGLIGGAGVLLLPDSVIGTTADENGPIFLGVGLGCGVVATALYLLAPKQRVKHVIVTPTASDEGAGLVLMGAF